MWKQYFVLACLAASSCVWSFNVESENYAIYRGEVQSMFGYSTAVYQERSGRGWVIVGAPLHSTPNLNGVERGGAVFKCDIAGDNRCFPIVFDKKGVNFVKSARAPKGVEQIDEKSYQWFGATVSASSEPGGPLLACAPKYHWFGYIKANVSVAGFKDAVGACWLASLNDGSSMEYSPCRNNETAGHHRQGMCQAGFGAALTKDGKRLFIGAPGSWYWQGQLFAVENKNVKLPFVPNPEPSNGRAGLSPYEQINLIATKEGPAYEDNNYLGYSVAVGEFFENHDSGVAVGVPRAADLHGKVLLFTSQLFNHRNITGEQMGAYFGYALAVGDIDGDSRDDLLVTAPFHTQPKNAGVKIESGRVYIFYYKGGSKPYEKYDVIDGESNRGQFGLSVASLGDIDLDGLGDFAVGEPYGGPENRGAVYIYHGIPGGVDKKFSQAIYSENLEQPVRTFGWSLSGGLDLDGNSYPDMVVGAYESNTAFYFRAQPVIKMGSEIHFSSESVNLETTPCMLSDGRLVACSELSTCYWYAGNGSWSEHNFTIHVSLDDKKKKNPRLFFLEFENKNELNWTVTIKKGESPCRNMRVYVAENLRDKLTSLDAVMDIKLANNNQPLNSWKKRDPKRRLNPVLEPQNTKKRAALIIQKRCGSDNICIPDLSMYVVKNVQKYLLGSGKVLELNVSIQNNGEDAFESVFYLELPTGIDYINIESQSEMNSVIIQCSAPKVSNNNTLRCDVGNPLPSGKIIKFKVFLQPITFAGMRANYDLNMKVNSTNPEKRETMRDNEFEIALPVWIETDLTLDGQSKPPEIDLGSVDFTNETVLNNALEKGTFVTHNYTIRNNGPSTVVNISTTLTWTAETVNGSLLLYIVEQPETSDEEKVRCQSANVDYQSLMDDRKARNVGKDHWQTKALYAEPEQDYDEPAYSSSLKNRVSDEAHGRYPRQANNSTTEKKENKWLANIDKLCSTTAICVHIQCTVGPLMKDEEVSIAAKYRVDIKTFQQLAEGSKVRVSSKMVAHVTAQPFIGPPTEPVIRTLEIGTTYIPAPPPPPPYSIPLWVIIVSALAGVLLLLLLILLLYKCGFFKRNRPSAAPERQPLNSH